MHLMHNIKFGDDARLINNAVSLNWIIRNGLSEQVIFKLWSELQESEWWKEGGAF